MTEGKLGDKQERLNALITNALENGLLEPLSPKISESEMMACLGFELIDGQLVRMDEYQWFPRRSGRTTTSMWMAALARMNEPTNFASEEGMEKVD